MCFSFLGWWAGARMQHIHPGVMGARLRRSLVVGTGVVAGAPASAGGGVEPPELLPELANEATHVLLLVLTLSFPRLRRLLQVCYGRSLLLELPGAAPQLLDLHLKCPHPAIE